MENYSQLTHLFTGRLSVLNIEFSIVYKPCMVELGLKERETPKRYTCFNFHTHSAFVIFHT